MPRRARDVLARAAGAGICALLAACSGAGSAPSPPAPTAPLRAANPAASRCLADGYELEPVLVDEVPVDHLCVDRASGRRCKVWEYFRGECRLPDPAPR